MATGRQAQFHDLQLDAAGVQTWERGITVDATMRTSASHIWAAGDVTGRHMYARRRRCGRSRRLERSRWRAGAGDGLARGATAGLRDPRDGLDRAAGV